MKILILLISSLLTLSACTPKTNTPLNNTNQVVVCTQEAKICPDGSAVERQGPNCEFAACPTTSEFKTINSVNLDGIATAFQFSVEIPATWEVQVVPEIESINFYDPLASGNTPLDQSQIFVRYFKANDFLTLSTVNINNQIKTSVIGRPAVIYDIEKKSGVANFPNQPNWRNQKHLVTDIRESDNNPSTFYVFGQRPDLNQEVWNNFLSTLKFHNAPKSQITDYNLDRISKKRFGTFVTPQNSPVSPEKFTGYHTAVDFEYDNVDEEVLVSAVMDGEVIQSNFVSGYGGVVVIKHLIQGVEYKVVYGHLDPSSLIANGSMVKAGQIIGVLGKGFSKETDGERKHLHFGLYKGDGINIKGYVSTEAELANWADPVSTLFSVE